MRNRRTFLSAKAKKLPYRRHFLLKSTSLIWGSAVMLNSLWLQNHHTISITYYKLHHHHWHHYNSHDHNIYCHYFLKGTGGAGKVLYFWWMSQLYIVNCKSNKQMKNATHTCPGNDPMHHTPLSCPPVHVFPDALLQTANCMQLPPLQRVCLSISHCCLKAAVNLVYMLSPQTYAGACAVAYVALAFAAICYSDNRNTQFWMHWLLIM